MKKTYRSNDETILMWISQQLYKVEGAARILFRRKKYIVDRSGFPIPDGFNAWTDFRVGWNIYTCVFKFGKWMLVADCNIDKPEHHAFKR